MLPAMAAASRVPGDENWDDRFGYPGVNAEVLAIAANGPDMFVAGSQIVQSAITLRTSKIAQWDGYRWQAMGGDTDFSVFALAADDSYVYAGGNFTMIGGVSAHGIARWDGAAWAGLDATDSTEDDVNGVAITDDGDVYVAGKFSLLSGLRAHNIARWREADQRWRTLGFGPVDGGGTWAANISAVYTLPDGKILVSGDFGRAAGKLANRLAIWDPINKEWAEWQGGANGSVFAIERNGDLLYFGGAFSQIGGISAPGIATYNLKTGQWASLGTGLDYPVNAIAFAPDGLVYIGGSFTATPNGPALLLALYNPATQTWSSTPLGFDPRSGYEAYVYAPFVASLVADSEGVLIGGWFRLRKINGALVQGTTPVGLIYWNRKTGAVSRFDDGPRLGGDSEGSINTIVPMPDGSFYVGGRFTKIGSGVAANNAARYSAAGWQPLGTGVRSADSYGPDVQVMRRNGDRLFVGGDFATAGNTTSENAAVWNIATGQWEALGDGVYGADFESRRGVKAIAFDSNAAYFGGHFWFAGAGQASGFAAWNFTSTQLPNQPPTQGPLDKKVFLPSVVR